MQLTSIVLALASSKLVIAHRGASGYLPEHTLPAAAYAYALGADYVEPDVVLTKDGVPVVLHDIHLEATTDVAKVFPDRKREDGRWYAIDFTLEDVKRLSVHERFDLKKNAPAFPKRFPAETAILKVPTLEEEILLVQGLNKSTGRDVGLYPEIKSPAFHKKEGQDISKVVLATLAKHGYTKKEQNIYLQCFDPKETKRLHDELKAPHKLVQLIAENSWGESDADYAAMLTEAGVKEIATYANGIGPWIPHVLKQDEKDKTKYTVTKLVQWAHANKLAVHPYTVRVDDLPEYAKNADALYEALFVKAGVDGLFTDFTDKAVDFLRRKKLR